LETKKQNIITTVANQERKQLTKNFSVPKAFHPENFPIHVV